MVGRGVDQSDLCPGDVFLDAVFDCGAVSGGVPVHPDVPVDRPEGVRDAGRDSHTVHPVVPVGGFGVHDSSDFSGPGVQVDLFDQHLVGAESAVGRKVDPSVMTPRGAERPGGDSVLRSIGFEKTNRPGADRVVIPIDAQLLVCRDAHHVGAFTVTEISLDGGDVRHPTGGVVSDDRIDS